MSKKVKVPPTPEEREAILARRVEKRELFSRTFEKNLAFLLALVFVFSVAHIAFHPNTTVVTITGLGQTPVGPAPVSPIASQPDKGPTGPGQPAPPPPSSGSQGLSASSSKEEILNYFNTAINDIKPHAKSITLKRSANSKAADIKSEPALPKYIQDIANDLIAKNMGEQDVSNVEPATKADAKNGLFPLPGQTWASKLTMENIEDASVSEANGVYTIVVKAKPDPVSPNPEYGGGNSFRAFNGPTPQVILDNAGVAKALISDVKTGMHDASITLTVDKATGHATYAVYHLIWDLELKAVKLITVDLSFGGDTEFEIAW